MFSVLSLICENNFEMMTSITVMTPTNGVALDYKRVEGKNEVIAGGALGGSIIPWMGDVNGKNDKRVNSRLCLRLC